MIKLQLFGFYPLNPTLGQEMQTLAEDIKVDLGFVAHITIPAASAVVASTTGVHVAVTANGVTPTVVTDAFTQPATPKCLTATAGGTATDIKAVQVVVEGTDYAGDVITETLPVFTVDTAGTVQGTKAFKTVTKVTIPAMDGNGATVAIGFNEKLGIPYKLECNTVLMACLNKVKEGTAPTVTVSATELALNTIDLNSALNGTVVEYFVIV